MLLTKENILAIESACRRYKIKNLIIDPIIKSGTGVALLKKMRSHFSKRGSFHWL